MPECKPTTRDRSINLRRRRSRETPGIHDSSRARVTCPHSSRRQTHAIAPKLFDECKNNLTKKAAAVIHNTPHSARVLPNETKPSSNLQRRRYRATPCRFHPFIHSSLHAHSYTDRLHCPHDEIESATNLVASERANRSRKRRRGRAHAMAAPPPRFRPSQHQKSHTRSLAHSRLAAYAHTIRSILHQQHSFFTRRADDERGIGPTTHRPIPALVSHPPFPPCPPPAHPSIQKTSTRARVRAPKQRRVRPYKKLCVDTCALPPLPLSTPARIPRTRAHSMGSIDPDHPTFRHARPPTRPSTRLLLSYPAAALASNF